MRLRSALRTVGTDEPRPTIYSNLSMPVIPFVDYSVRTLTKFPSQRTHSFDYIDWRRFGSVGLLRGRRGGGYSTKKRITENEEYVSRSGLRLKLMFIIGDAQYSLLQGLQARFRRLYKEKNLTTDH